jgi:C4-dicarboxylate-specific signal transduction histidine kinase
MKIKQLEKLQWLMRLRWLALTGLSVAATLAYIGIVPGLNLPLIILAVQFGIGSNLYIGYRLLVRKVPDRIHIWQALLDTFVLSIVIWASGGIDCPFTSFYVFPVLLAVLLGGQEAFWPTLIASLVGLAWQMFVAYEPSLKYGFWNPIKPWDQIFHFLSLMLTIGMVAYFCARLGETIKQQKQAIQASDELLRLAFENLEAGVELIENQSVIWQNPYAKKSLGDRIEQTWHCPKDQQSSTDSQSSLQPKVCDFKNCGIKGRNDHNHRCLFEVGAHNEKKIYEILLLSPSKQKQSIAFYIDRTSEIAYQQKLINTERLASLGRTVQGVAHELNTPLATIQILAKDLIDAFKNIDISLTDRNDINESASMIVEEVQRCRRITHALLGKNQHSQQATLKEIIYRSIAIVYPSQKQLVKVNLSHFEQQLYSLDPLVQIFVNLLQNAKDVSPNLEIEINCQADEDILLIQVRDHGTGIAQGAEKYLFEPFFTTKAIGQGTGLGLYTSYTLSKALGGDLSLQNHPEGGALAIVKLPLS